MGFTLRNFGSRAKYCMGQSETCRQEEKVKNDASIHPFFMSCRMTMGIMTCFAVIVMALVRVNFTLAVVCMVKGKHSNTSADLLLEGFNQSTSFRPGPTSGSPSGSAEFDWDREFQGHALSSYFYGYILTQIVAGYLTSKYGGKHVLGVGITVSTIATFLIPVAARLNPNLLVFLRSVVGAGSGVIFPTIQGIWGVWAPSLERSFLTSTTYLGLNIGGLLAVLISSQFCGIPIDNGWPMAFYIPGCCCVVFLICWNIFVFSSPDEHPRISEHERRYIIRSTGISKSKINQMSFPWSKALTSPAVWAIIIMHTSMGWVYFISVTSLPLYIKDVLQFNVKENGLYSILPNLANILTAMPIARLADLLRERKLLSTIAVRKIYQLTYSIITSTILIALSFMDFQTRYFAVALMILVGPIQAFGRSACFVNPQDIAPRFAGIILGISTTFATLSGIFAPMCVGLLTSNGTRHEWRIIFYISAGFVMFGCLMFTIFAKGEVLDWAGTQEQGDMTMTEKNEPQPDQVEHCTTRETRL